jgi:hypothetical protein
VTRLSKAADAGVLIVGYRKLPSHQIVDAIDDGICGLRWLQGRGYDADRVVVAGDSAGGYLAFMTTLAAIGTQVARPAGVATISPFTDADPGRKLKHRNARKCSMFPAGALSIFARYISARFSARAAGRVPRRALSRLSTPICRHCRRSPSTPVPTNCCSRTPNSWRNAWKPMEFAVICTFGTDKFMTFRWRPIFYPRAGGPFDTSGISSRKLRPSLGTVAPTSLPLPRDSAGYFGSSWLLRKHLRCRSIRGRLALLFGFVEFRVDEDGLPLLLPVGIRCLQGHVSLVSPRRGDILAGRRVAGRALLLNGIGDGHVVGERAGVLGHGRRVTRRRCDRNRLNPRRATGPPNTTQPVTRIDDP